MLVRGDGVIYATGLTFTYTPEPGTPSSSSRHNDCLVWHAPDTAGHTSPRLVGSQRPPPAHIANDSYSVLTANDRFIDVL